MEKSCANHPESMALATCKACEKSICLMCVMDEKEGTFCSAQCHKVFSEVAGMSEAAAPVGSATAAAEQSVPAAPEPSAPAMVETPAPEVPKQESIFEIEPESPPFSDPEPLVAPGTKWRMIGAMCVAHTDTPAVATCDGCDKTLCALCLTETTNGTFCNDCVGGAAQPRAEEQVLAKAVPAPAPAAARTSVPGRVTTAAPGRSKKSSPALMIVALLIIVGGGAGALYFYNESGKLAPQPGVPVAVAPTAAPKPAPVSPNPAPPPVQPPKPAPVPPKPAPPAPPPPTKPPPPKPPPPRPPQPPPPATKEPKPEPILLGRVSNPWARQSAGAWFRFRMTGAGPDTYLDQGLKSKDTASFVMHVQKAKHGEAVPDPVGETKVDLAPYLIKAEEAIQIEDRKLLCEIRVDKSGPVPTHTWVMVEGAHAGAVLKKTAGDKLVYEAKRFWEHSLRVGTRKFDCIVIEGERAGEFGMLPVKTWHSMSVPGGTLREESLEGSISLIDSGDDWASRPPFPR